MSFVGQSPSIAFPLMTKIFSAIWVAYYSIGNLLSICSSELDSTNKPKQQEKARTGNHYGVNLYTQKSTASQIVLSDMNAVSEEKKQVIMNLYLSGIGEEFIAMQLDLEIPTVISILKALDVYGKSEAGLT